MSTILRVKRRLDENPQDALVLHCKRAKTASKDPAVFIFSGTHSEIDKEPALKSIPKSQPSLQTTKNIDELLSKVRNLKKERSCESRYEIVCCQRDLKDLKETNYALVDLEFKKSVETSDDVKYAYDLYYPQKSDFDVSLLDNVVSINNLEEELIYGMYQENRHDSSTDNEDSDDSNEENNWRNDYPEEEENESSVGEEDMRKAVENCHLGNDLSSDDGEENIYDDNNSDKDLNIDQEDIAHYGLPYAKYKAKILKERNLGKNKDLVHTIVDDYRDDDDEGFYYGQDEDTPHFRSQYTAGDSDDLSD